jgi:transcriptional regulator GlxA family with amidase domain
LQHSIDNVGPLDILVVPGPEPTYRPSPEVVKFLQSTVPKLSALLVICSGILPVAFSGLLEGKKATAPRPFLPILTKQVPTVTWTDFRWEKDVSQKEDGKKVEIWTSGGVTNGTDMIAAYVKEKYPPSLAGFVCAGADVGDRAREYGVPPPEITINF